MRLRLLSLFSGIGAFEKALTNIGIDYELVGFSEIDKWAIESYCAIHNVDKGLNLGDIGKIKNENLSQADIVTYGFPCQDVSIAGLQKGISKNTRSGLLYEAERIIQQIKPKYAIAENVKNLVGKRHKDDFRLLLKRLDSYGYNSYWKLLNAKDFGVPQNRERVFIVSVRKDVNNSMFTFPDSLMLAPPLYSVLEKNVEDKYNISSKRVSSIVNSDFNQEKGLIQDIKGNSDTLLARDYKDPKIVEVDDKMRKLTPLEYWRLMGFEDSDYWRARKRLEKVFYNGKDRSNSQMYKQAGNSIVVPVLEEIFKQLFYKEDMQSATL